MTTKAKDAREYLKFEEVYNYGHAAISKLRERRGESNDADERQKLSDAVKNIRKLLNDVRRAEIVELTSPRPGEETDPVRRLNGAIAQAKVELRAMEKLAKALAAANRLISLATRLIKIVA